MSLRDSWVYDVGEPEVLLFGHCLKAWNFDIAPGSRVLELGCNETNFAQCLKQAVPNLTVVGIDVRDGRDFTGDVLVLGDAADPKTYDHEALQEPFDWVISLGAIEHFGLTWYGDPKNSVGDMLAIDCAAICLKPGGLIYFDAPWTPTRNGHHETGHYRCYDDETLRERLYDPRVIWRARGWVPANRERDDYTQVRPMGVHDPFYYIAQWGQKPWE